MDFEELPLGSIDGQRGWSVDQGTAEVVAEKAFEGAQSLKLAPSEPFSQARLTLNVGASVGHAIFLDFRLLPVATTLSGTGPGADEMLDVDSARIGLFRLDSTADTAKVWVFNGDGFSGGTWEESLATVAVDPATGIATEWIRLSLRQDFVRQTWDLWVDGKLSAINLGFQDA